MGVAEVALEKPQGGSTLTSLTVAHIVAYHLPGDAIVVDDSTSSSFPLQKHMASTWPHDHLFAAGGSIGWGIAAAVGAAAACPTRKVICLTGDGAGAMAMQALWTQAHEQLDVVTVVYSNRAYSILRVEWTRAGLGNSAPDSYSV
jgi:acetolactate synthase-1/2/3 large subunit